jgi:hypothetical protein
MCGCFGNICTCICCFLYCLYCVFCTVSFMYIYSYLFCLYERKNYYHLLETHLQLIIIIIIIIIITITKNEQLMNQLTGSTN